MLTLAYWWQTPVILSLHGAATSLKRCRHRLTHLTDTSDD
jgi:hypothetical protein